MSVSVKRTALRKFLNGVLFERENIRYGMYDQPGPDSADNETPETESTVPSEVPIEPTEMMATQLADDRPPIEDEDFIPENPKELARAADQIARMIPGDQVAAFYRDMLRLYDDAMGEHNHPENKEPSEEEVTEESVRRQVRTMIEAISNWDQPRYAEEELSVHDWDPGEDEVEPIDNTPDGMSLEDLADQEGTGSITQMRQASERWLAQMRYMIDDVPHNDVEELRDFAAAEFIDGMLAGDYIDEEDAVELQQSPDAVKKLDSYRFFFTAHILRPAMRVIKKRSVDAISTEIDKMNLPQRSRQTVLNQALGETPRSQEKLAKKINKDYKELIEKGEVTDDDPDKTATALARLANAEMPKLSKLAKLDVDILDVAKDKWGKQSKGRRQKALEQALTSTAKFQAGQKEDDPKIDWDAHEKAME